MRVLAINGISASGINTLKEGGFEVLETKVAQEQLENYISTHNIDVLLVGNNTEIQQELIDGCPSLKLIGCNTLTDNIDAQYAKDQGLQVIEASEATSNAKAELVFAHLFGISRYLHQSNREMPLEGDMNFNMLHKHFSQGTELRGKTLGIIGFDIVGREVAKIALAIGMKVIATKTQTNDTIINIPFYNGQFVNIEIETDNLSEIIQQADFISIHTDAADGYILSKPQFDKMKKGMGIVNVSQPGTIDEVALVNAIEDQTVRYAGLDVFENQPNPEIQLLMNPELSLSPNIGATTIEAEERIGVELANQIVKLLS